MTKTFFVLLLSVFLPLLCGCELSTRSALDERITALKYEIRMHQLRLVEIDNLKSDIDKIRRKTQETRARNKKFVNDTPGLRDKVKRHYPEAEALKP